MKPIFGLLLILITVRSAAQEIAGTVLDQRKEPLISAAVQVFQGGLLKGAVVTDYDGNYVVKPLDPGYYDLQILYPGFDSFIVKGVIVTPGNRTTVNANLRRAEEKGRTPINKRRTGW